MDRQPYGGRENLEAIGFLRRLNEEVYREYPDVQTYAEESTSWPLVSRPLYVGGLGFGYKWDMGWMHDTLHYMQHDPIHRKFHHNELTFRTMYASSENFVLPLSHDEVVHGKGSLLDKMPGQDQHRFANLRLLYGWQHAQPGKKLLFMGGEFGQGREWNHDDEPRLAPAARWIAHQGMLAWVRDLNRLHAEERALHARDCDPAASSGSTAATPRTAWSACSAAGAQGDRPVLASSTSRRWPAAVPDRRPGGAALERAAQRRRPGVRRRGAGNLGGVKAEPVRPTAGRTRSRSPCRRSPRSSSCPSDARPGAWHG